MKPKKKTNYINRIKHKYRFVVLRDDTFEEKMSFRLSVLNIIVFFGILSSLLILVTFILIAFTPLREYIPGYTNLQLDQKLRNVFLKVDTLSYKMKQKDLYINNIKNLLQGKVQTDVLPEKPQKAKNYNNISNIRSEEDSLLRVEMEDIEKYSLVFQEGDKKSNAIDKKFFFFCPLKGTITDAFNLKTKHYGIDIVANQDEAIKSILDGVVVFSTWTLETGYVIGIQHYGNIISIYKHNSALLKEEGNVVKAGEVIAILGASGELSSGPHLHFEMWINGNPVNPVDYISF